MTPRTSVDALWAVLALLPAWAVDRAAGRPHAEAALVAAYKQITDPRDLVLAQMAARCALDLAVRERGARAALLETLPPPPPAEARCL